MYVAYWKQLWRGGIPIIKIRVSRRLPQIDSHQDFGPGIINVELVTLFFLLRLCVAKIRTTFDVVFLQKIQYLGKLGYASDKRFLTFEYLGKGFGARCLCSPKIWHNLTLSTADLVYYPIQCLTRVLLPLGGSSWVSRQKYEKKMSVSHARCNLGL